jgi:HrpA-like RNA helicase
MASVVGSNMSQLESVSVISGSVVKKPNYMKLANQLHKFRIDEEEDDTDLGMMNTPNLPRDMQRVLNAQGELPDEPDEVQKRQMQLEQMLSTYTPIQKYNKLPITNDRDRILFIIDQNQFCVIQGSTGCGKTTQVPQYILDSAMAKKKYCNIIVTQPRRIAAISVAKRVCQERNWTLGQFCGYQIGLDRRYVTEDTRITYVTTGVLLQKLIGPNAEENFNSNYTHIILDEVHERDLDTDFVLLIIKLKTFSDLRAKVILMSATINADLFRNYFTVGTEANIELEARLTASRTPLFSIEASTYKVQEFYWDDLTAPSSFMSSIVRTSYKSKLAQYKKAKYDSNAIFERNRGFNFRSFNFNQKILDQRLRSLVEESPDQVALDAFTREMRQLEFRREEPVMQDAVMLMVVSLLKYFDEQDVRLVKATNREWEEKEEKEAAANNAPVGSSKTTAGTRLRVIDGLAEVRGSVLIFVPGMEHIKQLQELLEHELPNNKLRILPLHSDIVIDQQNLVFQKTEPTWRKVIISTTIAESSITVPDVKYVIDFCLTKELYCDPFTNYTHLRLEWASKSSLNQRLVDLINIFQ